MCESKENNLALHYIYFIKMFLCRSFSVFLVCVYIYMLVVFGLFCLRDGFIANLEKKF